MGRGYPRSGSLGSGGRSTRSCASPKWIPVERLHQLEVVLRSYCGRQPFVRIESALMKEVLSSLSMNVKRGLLALSISLVGFVLILAVASDGLKAGHFHAPAWVAASVAAVAALAAMLAKKPAETL